MTNARLDLLPLFFLSHLLGCLSGNTAAQFLSSLTPMPLLPPGGGICWFFLPSECGLVLWITLTNRIGKKWHFFKFQAWPSKSLAASAFTILESGCPAIQRPLSCQGEGRSRTNSQHQGPWHMSEDMTVSFPLPWFVLPWPTVWFKKSNENLHKLNCCIQISQCRLMVQYAFSSCTSVEFVH